METLGEESYWKILLLFVRQDDPNVRLNSPPNHQKKKSILFRHSKKQWLFLSRQLHVVYA